MSKLKTMREERKKIAEQANALLAALPEDDTRAEKMAEVDRMFDTVDAMAAEIGVLERSEKIAKEMAASPEDVRAGQFARAEAGDDGAQRAVAYRNAWESYMRFGPQGVSGEQRQLLQQVSEQRAQTTSNTAGGYTIPDDVMTGVYEAMDERGSVRRAVAMSGGQPLRTNSGASLPIPTDDDVSNKSTIVSEGSQVTATDLTFGQETVGAFTYRTLVTVSLELLQDTGVPLEPLIRDRMAKRLDRGTNEHFTTGSGSGQPHGVVTDSAAGVTVEADAITSDNLIDLQHSVNRAYRRDAGFMFSDTTLKVIRKLKDADNRPLFMAGYQTGEVDTILGNPFEVNDDMADVGQSTKSVLYGDFSNYVIRDVNGVVARRLEERFIDYGLVGFILFSRHDGELIEANATTHSPVKHLVHQSG